jgi:outer membrane receptor protein involved in Fe transport
VEHGELLGALLHRDRPYEYPTVTKEDMAWMRYFTPFDVLSEVLPAYPLSQGSPGLVRAFSYAGASPDALSILFNGRPLRGVRNGTFDLELYPLEFVDRIEVLTGARAALYGSGESLLALNFVQPRFDVNGSYVRLWYAQSEHNLTGGDITYSRNLGSRSNLTLGFRRLPSDGEYENQDVSGWSARGSFRWHPSEALTLSLTEIFSDHGRGQNGGLEPTSPLAALNASVVNSFLDEDLLRHDLTLTARWYPGGQIEMAAVKLVDTLGGSVADTGARGVRRVVDTTYRIDGALYYTYARRALMIGEDSVVSQDRRDLVGARAGLDIPLAFARLEANGIIEVGKGGEPRFEAGGMLEIPVADVVALRGGSRIFSNDGERYVLLFGEAAFSPFDSLSLRGTLRQRVNFESAQPSRIFDGFPDTLRLFSDVITQSLAEASLDWRNGVLRAGISGFLRRAEPVEGIDRVAAHTVTGAQARLRLPLVWGLAVDNNLLFTYDPDGDNRFPLLHGTSDLYGTWTLFDNNLNARVGTSLQYQSGVRGAEYLTGQFGPYADEGSYTYPIDTDRPLFTPFPIWNAYIHARIGSAFIRLAMRNILDAEFNTLYRYPRWAREINLTVTWALID